jgi:uncharacterized protein
MNRLSEAVSPYLLQHAANPVHWHEWGEEAFERARAEDKPIFLSVGYATCHWCHVMAHESFEDEEVARLLNEGFVSIKLDREERPDVDALYMAFCQAATGQGGWPLSVFLTPDREPFYVGTYYPRTGQGNRPGMTELLPAITRAWRDGRAKVLESAAELTLVVRHRLVGRPGAEGLDSRTIDRGFNELAGRFDAEFGGFGSAPKFPTPHNLLFLLREHDRTGDDLPLRMVRETLEGMRRGGIWDHVGFGFHRYSTDGRWKLPHFEKMLYDQALLAMAYTEAWHVTREPLFRQTAEEIFEYVDAELTSPEGAFYSAEDADSPTPEGEMEEGAFYVWTWDEIEEVLGPEDAPLAIALYSIERGGNYLDEASRQATGTNVLHLRGPVASAAAGLQIPQDEFEERLEIIRKKLFERRAARARPLLDDKVLTDWNGLMIAALAKAAWTFDEPIYAERASRAAEFVLDKLRDTEGRLLHRYRAGVSGLPGLADDYAFLAWGLLELYQATFEPTWLREALSLLEQLLGHFWDEESGGLFLSPDDGENLLFRQKIFYDGATPSANSVAAHVLVRATHLTGRTEWEERAVAILNASSDIAELPSGHTMALMALQLVEEPGREVVIAGEREAADTAAMLDVLRDAYLPGAVWHVRTGDAADLVEIAPFIEKQEPQDDRATVYVCERFTCQAPVVEPESFKMKLAR